MADPVQEWCDGVNAKEDAGILMYREAPFGFLKLTSGEHQGRIVIKTHPVATVDDEDVTWFAPNLTWIYCKDIVNCTCVRVGWGASPTRR